MNNKKDVNNINETSGALATAYIMLYLLKIIFDNTYCDTDSIYLINNKSEDKNE